LLLLLLLLLRFGWQSVSQLAAVREQVIGYELLVLACCHFFLSRSHFDW
jgi:hypothetical protein